MAGSLLIAKSVRLQTEIMGTRKTRPIAHKVPADITEDRLGEYFSKFRLAEYVFLIISMAGIATGDFILQVTMDRKLFLVILDILSRRGCKMLLIVEVRRSHFWACDAAGHFSKACPGKNPVS